MIFLIAAGRRPKEGEIVDSSDEEGAPRGEGGEKERKKSSKRPKKEGKMSKRAAKKAEKARRKKELKEMEEGLSGKQKKKIVSKAMVSSSDESDNEKLKIGRSSCQFKISPLDGNCLSQLITGNPWQAL